MYVHACTASYSVMSSDKSTKSTSVQEANIRAIVNSMQRYLELSVCEGEEKNDPVPIKGKNQLTITSFAVATPRYSQMPRARLPIQLLPVKRPICIPLILLPGGITFTGETLESASDYKAHKTARRLVQRVRELIR